MNYNVKGLDQLLKALKGNQPSCRVGILGEKATATHYATLNPGEKQPAEAPDNATIGAAHEYGTSTLPQRSFLRVPIADRLQNKMEYSGTLDKKTMAAVVKSGTVRPWLEKIAILALDCSLDAFAGVNDWLPSNMRYKKNQQTLVETGQLRNSITYEVGG